VADYPDHYAALGVAKEATPEEIKKAYRRLARELHPDVNPGSDASERFKEVTHAYDVLSDPKQRQQYDLGPQAGGFGGGDAGFSGFGDIFDTFFGGGGQQRGSGSSSTSTRSSSAPTATSRSTPRCSAAPATAPAASQAPRRSPAISATAPVPSSAPSARCSGTS
jgi:DnaJ-class molecular chaperone